MHLPVQLKFCKLSKLATCRHLIAFIKEKKFYLKKSEFSCALHLSPYKIIISPQSQTKPQFIQMICEDDVEYL